MKIKYTPVGWRGGAILSVLAMAAFIVIVEVQAASSPTTFFNLPYSTAHYRQQLDLYLPSGGGPHPVVVFIHGGGWLTGNKSDADRFVRKVRSGKMALAAINYRYSWQAQFPAQIHDAKGAIRWLRANAAQYNLDPNRIAVFGESAGGHLAALVATSGGVSALEGNVGGNLQFSSRVQAAAAASPPVDLLKWADHHDSNEAEESQLMGLPMYTVFLNQNNPSFSSQVAFARSANPMTHITADDPPMALVHGQLDAAVPYQHSIELRDAMAAQNVRTSLKLVKRGTHNLPAKNSNALISFLRKELKSIQ